MRLIFFITLIIFCTGCLFSGSDIQETALVNDYYIVYSGSEHQLIRMEKDAATSAVIIQSNVDSIAFNSKYILAVSGSKYFVIDHNNKNTLNNVKVYNSYLELHNSFDIEDISLQKVN